MINIYRNFSALQRSLFPVGIVSLLYSAVLFIMAIPSHFDFQSPSFLIFAYGIIGSILSAACGIILVVKCRLFLHKIYIADDGIFIVSKTGKIKKSFVWSSIKKFVICEENGKCYVCISTDLNLPPEYTQMYGIIIAPFYFKNCISFPADSISVETLKKQLSRSYVVAEYTGSIKKTITRPSRRISSSIIFIALIVLVLILILLLWIIL